MSRFTPSSSSVLERGCLSDTTAGSGLFGPAVRETEARGRVGVSSKTGLASRCADARPVAPGQIQGPGPPHPDVQVLLPGVSDGAVHLERGAAASRWPLPHGARSLAIETSTDARAGRSRATEWAAR